MISSPITHAYEVRPRKDHRGADLISDALPFGRLWYDTPDNAIGYAQFFSRSHDAVIRVYNAAGNVIETPEHAGDFKRFEAGPQFPSSATTNRFLSQCASRVLSRVLREARA